MVHTWTAGPCSPLPPPPPFLLHQYLHLLLHHPPHLFPPLDQTPPGSAGSSGPECGKEKKKKTLLTLFHPCAGFTEGVVLLERAIAAVETSTHPRGSSSGADACGQGDATARERDVRNSMPNFTQLSVGASKFELGWRKGSVSSAKKKKRGGFWKNRRFKSRASAGFYVSLDTCAEGFPLLRQLQIGAKRLDMFFFFMVYTRLCTLTRDVSPPLPSLWVTSCPSQPPSRHFLRCWMHNIWNLWAIGSNLCATLWLQHPL